MATLMTYSSADIARDALHLYPLQHSLLPQAADYLGKWQLEDSIIIYLHFLLCLADIMWLDIWGIHWKFSYCTQIIYMSEGSPCIIFLIIISYLSLWRFLSCKEVRSGRYILFFIESSCQHDLHALMHAHYIIVKSDKFQSRALGTLVLSYYMYITGGFN